jgi:lipoate-protein ligase A
MSSEVGTSLGISSSRRSQRFLESTRNDRREDATQRLFSSLQVCHDILPHSAAMNMAIDEALLQTAESPSIRFYQWSSPALSFGYFGKFADVAEYATERDLVRRWTGGGIVFHGEDLTYSIIIPAQNAMFAESSAFIYAAIHSALRDALNSDCQRAELAPAAEAAVTDCENSSGADRGYNPSSCSHAPVARPKAHSSACHDGPQGRGYSQHLCFANPVRADVMIDNRKIAGAAQRRTRAGLLHQGSIQGVDLGNGLVERFAKELSDSRRTWVLPDTIHYRAQEISAQKYRTESWLRTR